MSIPSSYSNFLEKKIRRFMPHYHDTARHDDLCPIDTYWARLGKTTTDDTHLKKFMITNSHLKLGKIKFHVYSKILKILIYTDANQYF